MNLTDAYGRTIRNIRVSVTSRCNLNCVYCHREGEDNPEGEISREDIAEILRVAKKFGVNSVKFTGGEPLVRKDIVEIIASVPEGMESSITTNGVLLSNLAEDLKAAGLSRANVSLDTIDPIKYAQITGKDYLPKVLEGIDAAVKAGLTPVKINVVLLKGVNENELDNFAEYVRGNRDLIIQYIEMMEFEGTKFHVDLTPLEEELSSRSKIILTRRMHHRKKYCLDDAEVEIVRPMHNKEFCAHCNRLRVTSDGKLKPCLLRHDNHIDVRGKRGEELEALFKKAVQERKPFFT